MSSRLSRRFVCIDIEKGVFSRLITFIAFLIGGLYFNIYPSMRVGVRCQRT